jgi:hypothetical protein
MTIKQQLKKIKKFPLISFASIIPDTTDSGRDCLIFETKELYYKSKTGKTSFLLGRYFIKIGIISGRIRIVNLDYIFRNEYIHPNMFEIHLFDQNICLGDYGWGFFNDCIRNVNLTALATFFLAFIQQPNYDTPYATITFMRQARTKISYKKYKNKLNYFKARVYVEKK